MTVALALVSSLVPISQLAQISAALQLQFNRDFFPLWKIPVSVDAVSDTYQLNGQYPIHILDEADSSIQGIHEVQDGTPMGIVQYTGDLSWTVTASHEALEMAKDPFGKTTSYGWNPQNNQEQCLFLLEIADPVQSVKYQITQGSPIAVSDFVTPSYFSQSAQPGEKYSFTGKLGTPCDVLSNCYTYLLDASGSWCQFSRDSSGNPQIQNLATPPTLSMKLGSNLEQPPLLDINARKHFDRQFPKRAKGRGKIRALVDLGTTKSSIARRNQLISQALNSILKGD